MAAPSTTKWGNIVTGSKSTRKGKIGINAKVTETATTVKVDNEVWFWSMYSIDDSNNSYYYNSNLIGSIDINHTVATGAGWSTSNQTKLGSSSYTYTKGTGSSTKNYSAKLTGIDSLGSSNAMTVSTSVTVPALASYKVSYNANGGTGAPASQTKWYGKSLTLSSVKPTRSGYTFQGWATSASGSVVNQPGGTYTGNAAITYYAIWKANTYTVKYNANGGTGVPGNQTKTHGVTLKLSSTVPTRTDYAFQGWATTPTGSVQYAAGADYTANANVILYAVWKLSYKPPVIYNLSVARCDENGNYIDDGSYAKVSFEWQSDIADPLCGIEWEAVTGEKDWWIEAHQLTGTSGKEELMITEGIFDPERSYTISVMIEQSMGASPPATITLPGVMFPIDVKAEGKGIAFGKPAELEGVADFGFEAKFNEPVYGKALGMDKLPAIPEGSKLDDYMEPGCFAIRSNAIAATIYAADGSLMGSSDDVPPARAGRFEVWSSTGEGIRDEQWSYLRQRFVPYNKENAVWERDIQRGSSNEWVPSDWWRSTLTPAASDKVYHTQKLLWGGDLTSGMYMTAGHTANLLEPISEQPNGIVLVFSAYNGTDDTNYSWECFFVPKLLVSLSTSGHTFILGRGKFTYTGTKYLYIRDTQITGHDDNNLTGTNNGITYANNKFVLRYVIGV